MKHLILFLFTVSFASGIGCIIIGKLFYTTNKNALLKYLLRASYSLTCFLLIDIINFYKSINNIPYTEIEYLIIILGLLFAGMSAVHAFGNFTYHVIQRPLVKKVKAAYIASCVIAFVSIIILHSMYKLNIIEDRICIRVGFFIQNFYIALGVGYNIYLLIKFKDSIDPILNRVISWGLRFLLVMVPISLISNLSEFFYRSKYPKPFSPIIYFVLNMMGFYFVKNTFIKKAAIKEAILQNEDIPKKLEDGSEILNMFLSKFEITQREKEIIEYILAGHTNSEIGEKLFISPNTVKNHIYSIYKKMNIKNRYELIHKLSELQKQRV